MGHLLDERLHATQQRISDYQDVWIHGKVAAYGVRNCGPRYKAIRKVFSSRWLTDRYIGFPNGAFVLDLGANGGYFCHRLSEEFGARCLAIDPEPICYEIAEANGNPKVVVASKRIVPYDLAWLNREAHFDVVLALSVLHRILKDVDAATMQEFLSNLLDLGTRVIIETPSLEEEFAPNRDLCTELWSWLSKNHSKTFLADILLRSDSVHRRSLWLLSGTMRASSTTTLAIYDHFEGVWPPREAITDTAVAP